MTSLAETIKTFNSILESFLQQVSPMVGTSYHHYYVKLIKVNALLPIQYFIYYALPMQDKIMSRDESYFVNTENHKELIQENQLAEILRLQGIWSQLSDESKENVWDIFQALVITSQDYINLKK
jgi:hypothetical protein